MSYWEDQSYLRDKKEQEIRDNKEFDHKEKAFDTDKNLTTNIKEYSVAEKEYASKLKEYQKAKATYQSALKESMKYENMPVAEKAPQLADVRVRESDLKTATENLKKAVADKNIAKSEYTANKLKYQYHQRSASEAMTAGKTYTQVSRDAAVKSSIEEDTINRRIETRKIAEEAKEARLGETLTNAVTLGLMSRGPKTAVGTDVAKTMKKTTGWGGTAKMMIQFAAIDKLMRSGLGLFSFNSQLEQDTLAYKAIFKNDKTLTGTGINNKQAAGNYMKFLKKYTIDTPYQYQDLSQTSKMLSAVGGLGYNTQKNKAGEVIAPDLKGALKSLTDYNSYIGGTPERLNKIGYAIAHINAQGKLTATTMRELGMNGVPAWEMLSNSTGKTEAELQAMTKKGQITGEAAKKAMSAILAQMEERARNHAKAQSNTFSGIMSSINDSMNVFKAAALTGPFDTLKAKVGVFRDSLVSLAQLVERNGLRSALQKIIPAELLDNLEGLGSYTKQTIFPLLSELGSSIKSAVIAVMTAVTDKTDGAGNMLVKFAQGGLKLLISGLNLLSNHKTMLKYLINVLMIAYIANMGRIIALNMANFIMNIGSMANGFIDLAKSMILLGAGGTISKIMESLTALKASLFGSAEMSIAAAGGPIGIAIAAIGTLVAGIAVYNLVKYNNQLAEMKKNITDLQKLSKYGVTNQAEYTAAKARTDKANKLVSQRSTITSKLSNSFDKVTAGDTKAHNDYNKLYKMAQNSSGIYITDKSNVKTALTLSKSILSSKDYKELAGKHYSSVLAIQKFVENHSGFNKALKNNENTNGTPKTNYSNLAKIQSSTIQQLKQMGYVNKDGSVMTDKQIKTLNKSISANANFWNTMQKWDKEVTDNGSLNKKDKATAQKKYNSISSKYNERENIIKSAPKIPAEYYLPYNTLNKHQKAIVDKYKKSYNAYLTKVKNNSLELSALGVTAKTAPDMLGDLKELLNSKATGKSKFNLDSTINSSGKTISTKNDIIKQALDSIAPALKKDKESLAQLAGKTDSASVQKRKDLQTDIASLYESAAQTAISLAQNSVDKSSKAIKLTDTDMNKSFYNNMISALKASNTATNTTASNTLDYKTYLNKAKEYASAGNKTEAKKNYNLALALIDKAVKERISFDKKNNINQQTDKTLIGLNSSASSIKQSISKLDSAGTSKVTSKVKGFIDNINKALRLFMEKNMTAIKKALLDEEIHPGNLLKDEKEILNLYQKNVDKVKEDKKLEQDKLAYAKKHNYSQADIKKIQDSISALDIKDQDAQQALETARKEAVSKIKQQLNQDAGVNQSLLLDWMNLFVDSLKPKLKKVTEQKKQKQQQPGQWDLKTSKAIAGIDSSKVQLSDDYFDKMRNVLESVISKVIGAKNFTDRQLNFTVNADSKEMTEQAARRLVFNTFNSF